MAFMQRGVWSGVLATSAMTTAMFAWQAYDESPLPPAQLTDELVPEALKPNSSSRRRDITLLSHFGFGIAMASIYAFANRARSERHLTEISKGSGFALLVWAGSYLGWIPALGLRPAAKRLSLSQNLMMIGTHLIWGATLGFSNSILKSREKHMLNGENSPTGVVSEND